ncbi:MAG: hypothetical protein AAF497_08035 [Planctomycetota bacterium]
MNSKLRYYLASTILCHLICGPILAGSIGPYLPPNTSKTPTVDLNHDELGISFQEEVFTIDIGGLPTGGENPENNVLIEVDYPGTRITQIGWDVTIQADDPSWLSEASINFEDALTLAPGSGDDAPGTMSYSSNGFVDLTMIPDGNGGFVDLSFDTDGLLSLEFFESFNDPNISPDGLWLPGSVITLPIPEPYSASSILTGMFCLIYFFRLRNAG